MAAMTGLRPANFDRLAAVYQTLERAAFGRDLERARFHFLDRLRGCRSILLLGEGDGRCLQRLREAAPLADIHCVDASARMISKAAGRIPGDSGVTFEKADVRRRAFASGRYDAVVTFFFLDCFTPEEAAAVVSAARASLRPGALWLFADFVVPAGRLARWHARASLALMYAFFRWQTGLTARTLPPSEQILERHGLRRVAVRDFRGGFVRSAVFRAPGGSPEARSE
jgi:SAM-dependent methyltransferase